MLLIKQMDEVEKLSSNDVAGRLQMMLKGSGKLVLLDKLLVKFRKTRHCVLVSIAEYESIWFVRGLIEGGHFY